VTTPSAGTAMHPQLTLLLEIQDLRSQYRELKSEPQAVKVEREHFNIDLEGAIAQLGEKIEELEETLSPAVRARYRKIVPQRDRVVVPVVGGVCYGCFVSIATATVGNPDMHTELRSCEGCGSFIYVLS
jgi:predicted  nucleic acid-binding Zn-ribbon protein